MKNTFLQSMGWLHTWAGLFFGWILFGILLAGSLAVFYSEINYWAVPEMAGNPHTDRARSVEVAVAHLQSVAPDSRLWQIILPAAREPILRVVFKDKDGKSETHRLDPDTGQVVTRDVRGGLFFYRYHYELLIDYNKNKIGLFLVAAAGIVMLVACVSGIVIHKHIFRDFFTFRPRSSPQRSWLDAHNVLGVLPLPFHVMMAYTGLVLYYWLYVPAAVNVLYGGDFPTFRHEALYNQYQDLGVTPGAPAPLAPIMPLIERAETHLGAGSTASIYVRDPNRANAVTEIWRTRTDRVSQHFFKATYDGVTGEEIRLDLHMSPAVHLQSSIAALHWIEWGGPLIRWVYFLCGLAGAGTTALGLVLFTVKRQKRTTVNPRFFRLIHSLNIASVAGFSIACAAFMWAERLVPFELAGRNVAINNIFVAAWLVALIHALWRKPASAWAEQFGVCGLLCFFLPITGIFVHRDLFQTLAAHDWIRSGIDLTAMGIGVILIGLAWHLHARNAAPLAAASYSKSYRSAE